jgi:arsenate reductase-like glutaredoxin family protein
MINNQPGELTLLYNSEKSDDKKARGYVESLPSVVVKTLDLSRESITETQLAQIAIKLGIPVSDMIDPTYDDNGNPDHKVDDLRKMEGNELLKLMAHNTMLLATPIIILGDKAYKFGSSYELIQQWQANGVKTSSAANVEEKQ